MFGPQDLACLQTILVETDEPLGPYGAKSISEVPINGPAPAIANAVYNAVGIRLRKLPMRPEDVLNALAAQPCKTGDRFPSPVPVNHQLLVTK